MHRLYEPPHEKNKTKWHVRPAKTQISPVWSESSLSTWRKLGSLAIHWAHSEDFDQSGQMPRLILVFTERIIILLVLSWGGSIRFNLKQYAWHCLHFQVQHGRKVKQKSHTKLCIPYSSTVIYIIQFTVPEFQDKLDVFRQDTVSYELCILVRRYLKPDRTWAVTWQNQQNECAPSEDWRRRSALASAQSDQSSLCTQWLAKDPSFLHVDSKDSDQTGRMPRLICLRWAHTHFVGFVMSRLTWTLKRCPSMIKGIYCKNFCILPKYSDTQNICCNHS